MLNHSIDSIETVIAKDVDQFYKNLNSFIKYRDTKNSFNDTVLQKLRNSKVENIQKKLDEIFLHANK
ncbi:MAG: hypothetical protein JEZ09_21175 [Salinivirgaceae bacterium]|nr:hypothetical protein [Salinivirgaceae bacterium]